MTEFDLSFGQLKPGADQRLDPVGVSPGQSSKRVPRVPGKGRLQSDVAACVGPAVVC